MSELRGDNLNDQTWRASAECRDAADPDIFFPEKDEHKREKALALCGACAVKNACYQYAVAHHEKDGIWGGGDFKEKSVAQAMSHKLALSIGTETLRELQGALNEREYEILKQFYGLEDSPPQTYVAIGEHLGITRQRVAIVARQALLKVHHTVGLAQ